MAETATGDPTISVTETQSVAVPETMIGKMTGKAGVLLVSCRGFDLSETWP